MLEANATPVIAATLILLLIICIWWLVVEWGFKKPAAAGKKFEHQNGEQVVTRNTNETQSCQYQPDQNRSIGSKLENNKPERNKPEINNTVEHQTGKTGLQSTTPSAAIQKKAATSPSVKNIHQLDRRNAKNSVRNSVAKSQPEPTAQTNSKQAPVTSSQQVRHASGDVTVAVNKDASSSSTPHSETSSENRATRKTDHGSKPAGINHLEVKHQKAAPADSSIGSDTGNPGLSARTGQATPSATGAGATTKASVKASAEKESPLHTAANRKPSLTKPSKYQTAAKTQSPSVRSEASIQIPTRPRKDNSKNNESLHAMLNLDTSLNARSDKKPASDVAADSAGKPSLNDNARKLKSVPNVSVAQHPTNINKAKASVVAPDSVKGSGRSKSSSTDRRQSPIERAMAQQIGEQQPTAPKGAAVVSLTGTSSDTPAERTASKELKSEALKTVGTEHTTHANTALRAQLASSERRIESLQSTLTRLQQNQLQTAEQTGSPADRQMASPHSRPTLMSKIRILDAPRN